MPLVHFADLYAGKIMAALDRRHPRDLFDVRDLLANEGIDDTLRKAFIVYLLSHNRPMGEGSRCASVIVGREHVIFPTRTRFRDRVAGEIGVCALPILPSGLNFRCACLLAG